MAIVTPGYFQTIGVPYLEGRDFSEHDDSDAPQVAIVNRAFAARFFPGASAIGKRIIPGATSDARGVRAREIIAVAGNAKQTTLRLDDEPVYYLPYRQMPWCCPSIIVRTAAPPL